MQIDAVERFQEACQEIHLLINYSKRNTKSFKKYATFNKAAVVLLCAKFEAFLEDFLAEYAEYHLNASSNHTVERTLFAHLIDCILQSIELSKSNAFKRKASVSKLEELCGGKEIRPISHFPINTKLRFGKHGQGEVERLLQSFGFSDYAANETVKVFFSKFNSLYSIRNNIIHEDATPSLTHQNVESYLDEVSKFINGLEKVALEKLALAV